MRGAIFDVEGTLVDCAPQNLQSWQDTLATCGLIVPIEVLQLYSGMDSDEMLQIVAPKLGAASRKRAAEAEEQHYRDRYLHTVKPLAGVAELFEAIKADGGKIALATDCKGEELKYYREILGVDHWIDAIACGDEVDEGKPSSALVELAVKKLDVDHAMLVMIGDTPYDGEAARSAGVAALGLLTGGFSRKALIEAGCFQVAQNLSEAKRILLDRTARRR
jgi:HAD superfamily hydrolase (TIGR01549 family)